MKKLFTVAAISIFAISTYAQDDKVGGYKPCEGSVTTEVGLTGGLNNSGYDLNNGTLGAAPMLRFRYFIKEDLGLRIGFSAFRNASEGTPTFTTVTAPTPTPPTPNPTSTTSFIRQSSFDVNIGVEKHFAGTDRLSTYAGADLVFGTSGNNEEETDNPSGDYTKLKNANRPFSAATVGPPATPEIPARFAETYFGVRLITGADYYIAKKLYLGVEVGLAFLSTTQKDTVLSSQTTTGSVVSTSETTISPDNSGFEFSPRLSGGVRLGYQF
ncbi:outer membrane beta-barrel protein [Flavobacterium sp.]|uniref:outer membrane beta-barrel protein n=1 Tax=Flavobacterium sp. TaxID=239 RepID=UPI00286BD237|nr:outer membrane beta-barrel protein [Flavobacterium sp.]